MPLLSKIQSKDAIIGVVGLGYVGLPLILAFAAKGFRCVGFDIDAAKVAAINAGNSYIAHIDAAHIQAGVAAGLIAATADFTRIADVDAVILCVPTPLDIHMEPDLSYVTDTLDAVVPHLRAGTALSLESTTYPGTTEEEVVTRVVARGLVPGESVFVVYSPEREDPGNPHFAATNIPKVVGGHTPACLAVGSSTNSRPSPMP
jgi:UDP-N-acetyl-D-glucosamine dehydrogenase